MDSNWLWIAFTVVGAAGQTARNAMQRELSTTLGTVGATLVRFLFGFPFALVFLAVVLATTGAALPRPELVYWPWLIVGALTQVLATAMMLALMGDRSFLVAIAYLKTEPVQVAVFGLLFLGDRITPLLAAAICIATLGVMLMSRKGGGGRIEVRPMLLGTAAGAMFAISTVAYRGAILSLDYPNFVVAATFSLALGLVMQAALLSAYLALLNRALLSKVLHAWRPSLFAGFMGASASQFWFLAFALTSAASVRTLGLLEVLFAQAVSRFVFKQKDTPRERLGVAMIVAGVLMLIWANK